MDILGTFFFLLCNYYECPFIYSTYDTYVGIIIGMYYSKWTVLLLSYYSHYVQIQTYCSFDTLNSSSNATLGLVAYVLDTRTPYVYTIQGWQQVQV